MKFLRRIPNHSPGRWRLRGDINVGPDDIRDNGVTLTGVPPSLLRVVISGENKNVGLSSEAAVLSAVVLAVNQAADRSFR
jgi:hypothetical protein